LRDDVGGEPVGVLDDKHFSIWSPVVAKSDEVLVESGKFETWWKSVDLGLAS